MNYHGIYDTKAPAFLLRLAETPPMRRLRQVGMNCGCEYTAFPRFRSLARYTRFEHSLGAALIVWRFTADAAQSVSALLHDIATPPFAHVVDFLRGDYLDQTATESGTADIIRASEEIGAILSSLGLTAADVEDYLRYPIADNDAPRLSADRLEYTVGNAFNFSLAPAEELAALFADITPGRNEYGEEELCFRTPEKAARFADLALACSKIYVSDADRYAMQILAELLRDALAAGVLTAGALAGTEEELLETLCADERFAARWRDFRSLSRIERAEQPDERDGWRRIRAKKRRIDPFVAGRGRVSALDPERGAAIAAFLSENFDDYVRGE